jgi:3-methyladenine DNA glycosylase AlkD
MSLPELRAHLRAVSSPEVAKASRWFFKTGPGQYGEGDIFMGIKVPVLRAAAKKAKDLSLAELQTLLDSEIHEERLIALLILDAQYAKTADPKIVDFYLKNTHRINNWDLVDSSAPYILGMHLLTHDPKILYDLVKSKNLWERRIAIISTAAFIRAGHFKHTLALSELLLGDKHDLMHKAVGWMLREVGKRDQATLEKFLTAHSSHMPRTALRYAIERFPEPLRKQYLKRSV